MREYGLKVPMPSGSTSGTIPADWNLACRNGARGILNGVPEIKIAAGFPPLLGVAVNGGGRDGQARVKRW
jgi:hypothetical protein